MPNILPDPIYKGMIVLQPTAPFLKKGGGEGRALVAGLPASENGYDQVMIKNENGDKHTFLNLVGFGVFRVLVAKKIRRIKK